MPTPTYDLITSTTLAASSAEVVFGSIPQTYRDLILVSSFNLTAGGNPTISFNGDTGANYSRVYMLGTGSSALSGADTSRQFAQATSGLITSNITQIMDYSATDKHKTFLVRDNNTTDGTIAYAFRWANTAAINSINITASLAAGVTISLYGVIS
jgi:hypothetical protein